MRCGKVLENTACTTCWTDGVASWVVADGSERGGRGGGGGGAADCTAAGVRATAVAGMRGGAGEPVAHHCVPPGVEGMGGWIHC